ncbi:hypothetical protein C8J57DRAFT_1245018 [Mycena rebaudengoi]|nr:hypothetical protein C8J57DRAFT_1245018 [Mycena rebaudengoi]
MVDESDKSSVLNITQVSSIPDDAADEGPTRKKPKKKIPKERDILPVNEALNGNIGALRAKWICPTPGGLCGNTHCYVHPDDRAHFPLSHNHMNTWAAAMLKGEQFATVEKPPNTGLFDGVGPASLAARSPLLSRRLELQEKKSTSAAPQITTAYNSRTGSAGHILDWVSSIFHFEIWFQHCVPVFISVFTKFEMWFYWLAQSWRVIFHPTEVYDIPLLPKNDMLGAG